MPSHDSHDQQPADPSPSGPDHIDAEFAKIVASFDAAPQWPAPEASGDQAEPAAPAKGPIWPAAGPVLNQPSLLDGLDTFGAHLPDDAPEKFVPPTPPPWPKIPFAAILAVVAVILGFYLFFDREVLPVSSEVNMLFGVAGVLGGAAALIMRLRPGSEEDDSPDDGAVV